MNISESTPVWGGSWTAKKFNYYLNKHEGQIILGMVLSGGYI